MNYLLTLQPLNGTERRIPFKLASCFSSSLEETVNHQAQMAESVDALVSNTSGATRAGSTPALGTAFSKHCKAMTCGAFSVYKKY